MGLVVPWAILRANCGKIQVGDNFGSSVYYDNSDFIFCIPFELLSEILVKAKDYMTNINLKSTRVDNLY